MNENAILGAPKRGCEWRIALRNHYAWLQTHGWRMHERKRNSWGSEKGKAGPNGPPGFFHQKRQTCFLQRKINHSREHHILEKQYTYAKGKDEDSFYRPRFKIV